MAVRIAAQSLNATTRDIMNVIRENASYAYQNQVPVVNTVNDIPVVGEIILGYPALANEYVSALLNRIALVLAKSMTFNNPYTRLKKGYLEWGETIEEIFTEIAKVRLFDPEKAPQREFQRNLPDVKSAFHAINWQVQYPVTLSQEQLKRAFLSADGMVGLVSKILDSPYRANEYDEFLLFKYMLIKAVNLGEIKTRTVESGLLDDYATEFRATSSEFLFPSRDYNYRGVLNNADRDKQAIFMDARFNASFDVNVLASAFNMDKANFMGRLHLIDTWNTFDNSRWEDIRKESNCVEEVTDAELEKMSNIKAIILDEDWFQVYDNLITMGDTPVKSGLYWNYFLTTWKTISWSPFANAVAIL